MPKLFIGSLGGWFLLGGQRSLMGHASARKNCIGKTELNSHIQLQQKIEHSLSAWLFAFLLEAALAAWLLYIEGG